MTLDLRSFADKIVGYRKQFEFSREQLAAMMGIGVKRLELLEAGLASPTGDEVLILADVYKCDYRFFVSNEKVAPFNQTDLLFRMHGSEFSGADRWSVQEFLFLCGNEHWLLGELGRVPATPFSFAPAGDVLKRHGPPAADAVRRYLGRAAADLVLDIYEDCRRLGIHVFRRQLENSNISGLCIRDPIAGPCVLVNYSEDVFRQRFTCAHELAHAILDFGDEVVVSYSRANAADKLKELRANAFAGALLAPPAYLRALPASLFNDDARVLELAKRLMLSTHALSIALVENDLIDPSRQEAIAQLKVPKHQKQDPELPATLSAGAADRKRSLLMRGLSRPYVQLCVDAYSRGLISLGRAAEMLMTSQAELTEISSLYELTVRA